MVCQQQAAGCRSLGKIPVARVLRTRSEDRLQQSRLMRSHCGACMCSLLILPKVAALVGTTSRFTPSDHPCFHVYPDITLAKRDFDNKLSKSITLSNFASIEISSGFHNNISCSRIGMVAPIINHSTARHKMIEGGWWKAYTKNGRYIGIIEGDEFIVGKTRILYRISKNKLYSTEVPPSLIADILEKQAITTNGEILLKFSKTTRERRL